MAVIDVRPMAADDDPAVYGRIVRDAYLALPGYPEDPEYDDDLARVADRAAYGTILVATCDGAPAGCLTFVDDSSSELAEFDDADCTSIRMFGVDPRLHGAGIGAAMLEWCIATTRRLGRPRLCLHTLEPMSRAMRLYERFGFVRRPDLDEDFGGIIGMAFVLDVSP